MLQWSRLTQLAVQAQRRDIQLTGESKQTSTHCTTWLAPHVRHYCTPSRQLSVRADREHPGQEQTEELSMALVIVAVPVAVPRCTHDSSMPERGLELGRAHWVGNGTTRPSASMRSSSSLRCDDRLLLMLMFLSESMLT